jgi:hypothetical protein
LKPLHQKHHKQLSSILSMLDREADFMGGPSILRYASLQYCETLYDQCLAALTEGQGTIVISTSGGGESETRSSGNDGGIPVMTLIRAVMRRMHQLDPIKYPLISNRLKADFSGLTL